MKRTGLRKTSAKPKRLGVAALVGLFLAAGILFGGSTLVPESAQADQAPPKAITCEEKIPKGAKKPKIRERFPGEAIAGFGVPLELEIRHGKGETPLPTGFKIPPGSSTAKFLEEAGFLLAEPDGGSGVVVDTFEEDGANISHVTIPFVVTPLKSGNHSQTLPQMPLTIGRQNGDTFTLCTQLHLITVLDPTAGEEDPMPKPNPPGRTQREYWKFLWYLMWVLIGLLVVAMIMSWWVRKQMIKPVPAPIPVKRLPWEQALTDLAQLAGSPLLEPAHDGKAKRTELFDEVSDTLRRYLGDRYGFDHLGFDGLETTTHEMLGLLKRVRPSVPSLELIQIFLAECDLVKFARVVPEAHECNLAIQRAETIVRATMPAVPAPAAPGAGPSAPPGPAGPSAPPPPDGGYVIPPRREPAAFTPMPPKDMPPKDGSP